MPSAPPTESRGGGQSATAGSLVVARLGAQRDALRSAEADVLRGEPEGVHDLRVAIRRIRSALATFRSLVDASRTEPVRAELRWAADQLGGARDAEVAVERVTRWLEDEPGTIGGPEAGRRVLSGVAARRRAAHTDVAGLVGSTRFAGASAAVDRLVEEPPLSDAAHGPAAQAARACVRSEANRLWQKVGDADAAIGMDARARLLHEVRKAAKRLRYAAEAGLPYDDVGDLPAIVDAAAEVQELLGDHHDAVVTMAAVRAVAATDDDPAVARCCGRIAELEAVEIVRLEGEASDALERLEQLTR